jgi:uncharacterized protein YhfF
VPHGLDHDNYVVGSFGDSPEMATKLADLVIAGIKRITASLVRDYGDGREPMAKPGDFVMTLDGEGPPRFISRTTEVMIKPLSEVDEAFGTIGEIDEAESLLSAEPNALTNHSYPGVCFTKYAPGPEDQPNRSNLTA